MINMFLIFLILLLTAFSAVLVGNFLVLRRMALMADAISHAVLPGIVIAFLIVGTLDSPLFFLLAVFFALLMTFVVQLVTDNVHISRESVIGIVFTFLFSLGVVLLVRYANDVHLDQDAVLFGQLEFAIFDRFSFWGGDFGPRALWVMLSIFLVNLFLVWSFFKEFKVLSFDKSFAQSVGIKVRVLHYLLMFMTAMTVVAAFEVTGPILVVSLLVIPSLSALVLARSFFEMIFLSFVFAALASVLGMVVAYFLNLSLAGSVAFMAGLVLFVEVGLMHLWRKRLNLRLIAK